MKNKKGKKQYKIILAVLLAALMIASGFGSLFGIIDVKNKLDLSNSDKSLTRRL